MKNFHFKYGAFTDDIVFFIEEPKENLPKLLEVVKEFGQFAGFFINKKIKINSKI